MLAMNIIMQIIRSTFMTFCCYISMIQYSIKKPTKHQLSEITHSVGWLANCNKITKKQSLLLQQWQLKQQLLPLLQLLLTDD